MDGRRRDRGFTLIEVLLVIVILGIVAAVVVLSVGGVRGRAEESACASDRRALATAAKAYFVQTDTDTIPDLGDPHGFERALVAAGLLGTVSTFHDLTADGQVVLEAGQSC